MAVGSFVTGSRRSAVWGRGKRVGGFDGAQWGIWVVRTIGRSGDGSRPLIQVSVVAQVPVYQDRGDDWATRAARHPS